MASQYKDSFRIHVGLVLAEVICVPAFLFEISRALAGNELSWVYVFEWPMLGGYAIHIWRRLLRDVRDEHAAADAAADAASRGEVNPAIAARAKAEAADPELRAWNEYLERVHAPQTDERVLPDT
ncbi:MAG: hypothetical protein ACRDV0_05045 [Acidimicrobiales bacterium]